MRDEETRDDLSPTKRALLAIRQLRAQLDAAEDARHAPIAIVGMSCRLPGADSVEDLWSLLTEGREGTGPVPRDRWDADALYHPDSTRFGRLTSRRGGFLRGLDAYDPAFFGISTREAPQVDPRQRLVLELTWEALEDAGIPPGSIAGSNTSTMISVLRADYEVVSRDQDRQIETYTGTGMASTIISNRLAYVFDLHGPSMTIDTACSGSLVGMHLACRDLREGTADLSLVGGVAINLLPWGELFFSRLDALASDGRCKTFDDRADGIVRSEGAGMIVLQRLDDAIAAGRRIYAVIRGSAVNQDGRSNGMMAPNGHAQRAVLEAAYADARVAPQSVQYVEAHGTGTKLGDPIEVDALDAVLSPERAPGEICKLGSIKTNIGHAEPVAGVAGVIKTALCMYHRELVPTLHFEVPNRKIPFDRIPLEVQTTRGPWPRPDQTLRAGVSGFGFGGTNAHVVLEEAPAADAADAPATADDRYLVLPISARAPGALRGLVAAYRERIAAIEDPEALRRLVRGAIVARDRLPERAAFTGRTAAELVAALDAWLAAEPAPPPPVDGPTVFVFSGQGAFWFGMGRALYAAEPVFRDAFDAAEAALIAHGAPPIRAALFADSETPPDAKLAQRGTFAVQVALDALWRSRGLTPDVVVGHSLGEVAAAHAAGALSLADAAAVAYHRSRLMATTEGNGATAVIGLDAEAAAARMAGRGGDLAVAGNNRPGSTTVSGTPAAIDALVAELDAEGTFARRITGVRTAFHGPQMKPVQAALSVALAEIRPRAAAIPMISTVDAGPIAGESLDARYWGRNVREPFRFAAAVEQLCQSGAPVFVEVAPHRLLGAAIAQTAGRDKAVVIASMRRAAPGPETLAEALAAAFVAGLDIPPDALAPPGPHTLDLPRYPWQRARYWLDQIPVHDPPTVPWMQGARLDAAAHPLLGNGLAVIGDGRRVWRNALSAGDPAWVGDHKALGRVIFPGSGFAEIAAAAAAEPGAPVTVTDLRFVEALALSGGRRAIQIQLDPDARGRAVQIYSRADSESPWHLHADARLDSPAPPSPSADLDALRARCPEAVDPEAHYTRMAGLGLDYGPAFRTVRALHIGPGEVLGRVEVDDLADIERHHLHPALLDGCFQLAVHLGDGESSRLPERVDRIALTGRRTGAVWCHLTIGESDDPSLMRVDLRLYADDGAPVAAIDGLGLRAIDAGPGVERPARELVHTLDWVPEPLDAPAAAVAGRWLVVAEPDLAAALDATLTARGAAAVVTADPAALDDADTRAALFTAIKAAADWRGVVFSPASISDPYTSALTTARRLVALLRDISRQETPDAAPPKLWIVTRGAPLGLPGDRDDGLGDAAAWGIGRVLALEIGPLWGGLVDAPGEPEAAAAALTAELSAPGPVQVTYREGARRVPRLRRAATPEVPAIATRGAVLVTGGLAGVGLAIARALVDRGVRRLVLAGRTPLPARDTWRDLPPDHPAAERIAAVRNLEARGAAVHPLAVDVADRAALFAALDGYDALGYPAIRGVVHSAGVLRDAMLVRMADGDLEHVLAPKLGGAVNLAVYFADRPLDTFALFSSLTSVVGRVGQTAYAAANAALDALAHRLRSKGVPATSVSWGPWGEIGMFSRLDARQARSIARPMSTARAVDAFARLLAADLPHPVVADFEHLPDAPLFADLPRTTAEPTADDAQSTGGEPLLELFLLPEDERLDAIIARLGELVATVFRADPATLNPRQPLSNLGLDSLMAVEITDGVRARYGVELPIQDTFTLSVRALAERVADRVVLDEAALEALLAEIEALPEPDTAEPSTPDETGAPR